MLTSAKLYNVCISLVGFVLLHFGIVAQSIDKPTVLSKMYDKYSSSFDTVTYNFDSLSFAERYKDLNYTRTTKIVDKEKLKDLNSSVILKSAKGINDEIWFNLKYENVFDELIIFDGLTWVYTASMDAKSFKEKYINKKLWTDIRLIYNSDKKEFTVELKSTEGIEQFTAYPRFPEENIDIKISKNLYDVRYPEYLKKLEIKESAFNKILFTEKRKYDKDFLKRYNNVWKVLFKGMTTEEKQITEEEWIKYYSKRKG